MCWWVYCDDLGNNWLRVKIPEADQLSLIMNPLSYFPQGGNGGSRAISKLTPSPLGEGWEGGKYNR
jgi:hypothetical protein